MTRATPAGRGSKGSTAPATLLEQLRAERDPRADDERFYTGLGVLLTRSLEREFARMRSERLMYDIVNGRPTE